jgi:hypothetical protein
VAPAASSACRTRFNLAVTRVSIKRREEMVVSSRAVRYCRGNSAVHKAIFGSMEIKTGLVRRMASSASNLKN